MVAGALATDAPSSASDGLFLLGGTFTPDPPPPPPPPPDSDGDGILDPNDACPTVKAAPPDADRNGCTDAVVIRDARRLTSDFKYEWGKWRRNGRLHGAILRKVRIADASAGSKVRSRARAAASSAVARSVGSSGTRRPCGAMAL